MPTRSLILKLAKIFPQSLVAEIHRIFRIEDTEKLLTVFAGTNIHIPSTKELEEEERNLAIYETLSKADSKSEMKRLGEVLCQRFDMKRREIRHAYLRTKKKLKEAEKFVEADKLTSQHSPSPRKRKWKRKKRRKMK